MTTPPGGPAAGACPSGPPPGRALAQPHPDDQRRTYRAPRPGSPSGPDLLGPAHPCRRDDPGAHQQSARRGL